MKNNQDFIQDDTMVPVETQQDELDFDFEEKPVDFEEEPVEFGEPTNEENEEQQERVDEPQGEIEEQENESNQTQEEVENKEENVQKAPKGVQDIVLYMVIDRATTDMLEYFRSYGVNVAHIFSNIDDAKNEVMMQIDPCRIVIVDTGTGRFSLMGARKSLIDLLGMGDEDSKISVFYTDTIIKDDLGMSEQIDNKQVDWFKYRSTPDILANLLKKKKKENYVLDSSAEKSEHLVKPEDLMKFKGLSTEVESIDLGQPSIKPYDILMNLDVDNGRVNQLKAYAVKY